MAFRDSKFEKEKRKKVLGKLELNTKIFFNERCVTWKSKRTINIKTALINENNP